VTRFASGLAAVLGEAEDGCSGEDAERGREKAEVGAGGRGVAGRRAVVRFTCRARSDWTGRRMPRFVRSEALSVEGLETMRRAWHLVGSTRGEVPRLARRRAPWRSGDDRLRFPGGHVAWRSGRRAGGHAARVAGG
jgi:hypothetical protein